jgi:hypothetical protein
VGTPDSHSHSHSKKKHICEKIKTFKIIAHVSLLLASWPSSMDNSEIVGGVAEEYGILSSQCARVHAATSKLKGQTKLPKILQFNAHRARFFVATILSDEGAYGPVLVERKDGNISGLNT